MKKYRSSFCLILLVVSFFSTGCSNGSGSGMYQAPHQLAVDSVNDRLFVSQASQELFALTASTLVSIGSQPIIADDRNVAAFALMPSVVTDLDVYSTGSTSRLFIMGAFVNELGNTVFNRIRVLDFNGTAFTEADFSPIDISDGDAATDETDNTFADLLVDQANAVVYITDSSDGILYSYDATDGTAGAMKTLGGTPRRMSLDNNHLYVCNSTGTTAQRVVSVINVVSEATTSIDLGIPCSSIAVQTNDNGTVLMAQSTDEQRVLIRNVNTATYAASSAIAASDSSYTNGELISGKGISSSIGDVVLSRTSSSSSFYAYLSELDGNVEYVTIAADLSSYTHETLNTSASNISLGSLLVDSGDNGTDAFFAAETGALLSIDVGTTSVDVNN